MKISFKKIICLVLVAIMFITGTVSVYAARAKKYVSELKISYEDDEEDAKQALIDQGYIVITKNLNEDADVILSDEVAVYLGYKITQNPEEAITDMAVMSESNGYSFSQYQEMLKEKLSVFNELEARQMDLIEEFRVSYKAGRPLALTAYESLNNFVEDDSGKLIGDFFIDESLTHEDLFKLITQASQAMIEAFNLLLVSAVAEDADDNFLTKLAGLSTEKIAEMKGDESLYDEAIILYEQALALKENIIYSQKFVDDANSMTESELAAKNEDSAWNIETLENSKHLAVGEKLKESMIGDKSFYDLIMQEEFSITEIYPLAGILTKGQVAAINFGGYTQYISSMVGLSEKDEKELVEAKLEKPEVCSAYVGIDRTMFTDGVAVTGNAIREMNATGDKSPLYGRGDTTKAIRWSIFTGTTLGTAAISTAYIFGMGRQASSVVYPHAAKFTMNLFRTTNIKNAISATTTEYFVAKEVGIGGIVTAPSKTIGANPALNAAFKAANVLRYVVLVSVVASLIGVLMLTAETISVYNPTYTPVPKIMLDLKTEKDLSNYVRYNVVNGQDDKPGDLNGFVGKRWNALYTTKDPNAGKPVEATAVTANNNTTIKGAAYLPIHEFGSKTGVNLNNYTYNDKATPTYLYFTQDINYKPATTASVFSNRWSPLVTGLVGVLLGFGGCFFIMRRHKVDQTPPQQNTIG